MVVAAVFRGDLMQIRALMAAVERNCVCDPPGCGKCPAHQALLEQRFLDGLLWMRYLRERLVAEEYGCNSTDRC